MHSNSLLSAVIEKKFFQEYFLRNVELLFIPKLPVIEYAQNRRTINASTATFENV